MIGNSFQQLFLMGANELCTMSKEYGPEQQEAGFTAEEWALLCQQDLWSKAQRARIPSLLANAVSITLAVAGLPPTPLSGANVAAVICKLVCPCNRMVAAFCAPQSFDVLAAAGLVQESVVKNTTREQMVSLVTYFSSAQFGALESFALDAITEQLVLDMQAAENGV